MKIFSNIDDYKSHGKSVISLGFFDGVHIGHKSLLERTAEIAKLKGLTSIALTFDKHAGNYISGKIATPLIIDNSEKAYQISLCGLENLIFLEFCPELSKMSPEAFVTEILIKALNAKYLICGENYTFGAEKSGNVRVLKTLCEKYGLELEVVKPVSINGRAVSSSIIREAIQKGNIEKANLLLGREYSLSAVVETGRQIGRTIGIPTINQSFFEGSVIPAHGVYISRTIIDDDEYPSISNVGVRPTIDNQSKVNMETHIIRQYFDVYNRCIKVSLLKKIRDEKKFENLEDLKIQIRRDIEKSKEYFIK